MFDGSSIAGWKAIEKSDMKLMPDPASAYIDPFFAEKTLCLHCSVPSPTPASPTNRDPRGTAQKAEAYLKPTGIGDTVYFGPEAEFFIFDDVRFSNRPNKVSFRDRRGRRRLEHRHRLRDGQHGPPPRRQGRLLPAAAGRRRAGHPRRDALDDEADGHEGRQAPPRGGLAAARARPRSSAR